ncbi:sigma-70 family RNA polymerase sigma factor [Sunxiuqinia sp. sy24]|uniref:sigma-70 family RNA polymerase sigma factor n=1 Tax=Sunxiuqinia sp. sy24 TaxID=3461495 RepID=UPI00404628FB
MRQLKITKQLTVKESDSLEKYLKEIGKFRLLTAEEEAELAKRVKLGDSGALKQLVQANLRFVVSVAKQYQNLGLSLPDLINEGNIGLIKAVERFDETRGFKLISYCVWWVRQSILQALAERSRIIRLPLNKIGSIIKVKNALVKLEQEFQREPSLEEVASLLKITSAVVADAQKLSVDPVSMDSRIDEDGEASLYDVILNDDSPSPDHNLIENSLRQEIDRVLSKLNDREANVLRHYYGLNELHKMSLADVATEMGLSKERVRQMKERAIKKLKENYQNRSLKGYL